MRERRVGMGCGWLDQDDLSTRVRLYVRSLSAFAVQTIGYCPDSAWLSLAQVRRRWRR